MSFVDETVREIDEGLAQIKEEIARLEAARSALAGLRRRGRRAAAVAGARAERRGRAGKGARQRAALDLIEAKPGTTTVELVRALRCERPQAYGIAARLAESGRTRGDHSGWYLNT